MSWAEEVSYRCPSHLFDSVCSLVGELALSLYLYQ